ncbi:MAG: hypothetical protein A2051_07705 [Desulfovibrionales bacterium GWA2_65_9]|nr:MAG: hypothetical protein A2051_07705 [Desulfovibrionales bacterium GWA2_65_9]
MGTCRTLAIIPARGGSKGLPRKNILPLCGKPLIAYSIEAAQAASRIDRVIVSTEDEEIAEVALHYGAEVPFLRPRHLASASAPPNLAIDHVLGALYGRNISDVIYTVLYPTHPFRPKGLLDMLISKVAEGYKQALTVAGFHVSRNSFFRLGPDDHLHSLCPTAPPQCADIPGGYRSVAMHYRPYGLASVHGRIPGRENAPSFFHVLTDHACLTDIDYLEDFLLAEKILEHNLFNFETPCSF